MYVTVSLSFKERLANERTSAIACGVIVGATFTHRRVEKHVLANLDLDLVMDPRLNARTDARAHHLSRPLLGRSNLCKRGFAPQSSVVATTRGKGLVTLGTRVAAPIKHALP